MDLKQQGVKRCCFKKSVSMNVRRALATNNNITEHSRDTNK